MYDSLTQPHYGYLRYLYPQANNSGLRTYLVNHGP